MTDLPFETLESHACFGGTQGVYRHRSVATDTAMAFSLYLPPQAKQGPRPLLLYLSGLTCTWENATTKAGAQRAAAEQGLALLFPDTSPRGEDAEGRKVADDPAYDLGQGAGFYLDASEPPWAPHFKMESYLLELLDLVFKQFPLDLERLGVTGHSMGGHGALTLALRHPERFKSLSAFAPIVAPAEVPWGQKVLAAYLGPDRARWREHDACALVRARGWHSDILLDQGSDDQFLAENLQPLRFEEACADAQVPLTLRMQAGYDHSYYFVQSFVPDHLAWHAKRLG